MGYIKQKEREMKSVNEIDKINGIFKKYIDVNKMLLKVPFKNETIGFVDKPEDDIIMLTFQRAIDDSYLKIYSIVSERYIEFDIEKLEKLNNGYPENTYKMKITQCSLALDKREKTRYVIRKDQPLIKNLLLSKIKEEEKSVMHSISAQVLIKDFVERLDISETKKFFFKNDKDIPPEVQFVFESDKILYIKKLSDYDDFIEENQAFFTNSQNDHLLKNFTTKLNNLKNEYQSLAILPLQYIPIAKDAFTIGYLMFMTEKTPLEESDIETISKSFAELSSKIRHGNYALYDVKGAIQNISFDGALIQLDDKKLLKKIVAQESILFDLAFKWEDSIRVSAKIKNIYENTESLKIGVEFMGSEFGPKFKEVITTLIDKLMNEYKH